MSLNRLAVTLICAVVFYRTVVVHGMAPVFDRVVELTRGLAQ